MAIAAVVQVVEVLLPLTAPDAGVSDWSVAGLMVGAAAAAGVAGMSLEQDDSEQRHCAVRTSHMRSLFQ